MDSKRAWLVWGIGVFAYLTAITHRTSFGVAGLVATERFDATASALSAFTVIQLVVYAVLQIPVGVLVDRFGPRIMIATVLKKTHGGVGYARCGVGGPRVVCVVVRPCVRACVCVRVLLTFATDPISTTISAIGTQTQPSCVK